MPVCGNWLVSILEFGVLGRCRTQVPKRPWQERQTERVRALFDDDDQDYAPEGTLGSLVASLRHRVQDAGGLLAYKYFNWRKARRGSLLAVSRCACCSCVCTPHCMCARALDPMLQGEAGHIHLAT